jgi:hypothetical protein
MLNRLLATISCEDIGFGWIGAPAMVLDAHTKWDETIKKQKPKLSISDAWKCDQANRIVFDAVLKLCRAYKSRLIATSSGWINSLTVKNTMNSFEANSINLLNKKRRCVKV